MGRRDDFDWKDYGQMVVSGGRFNPRNPNSYGQQVYLDPIIRGGRVKAREEDRESDRQTRESVRFNASLNNAALRQQQAEQLQYLVDSGQLNPAFLDSRQRRLLQANHQADGIYPQSSTRGYEARDDYNYRGIPTSGGRGMVRSYGDDRGSYRSPALVQQQQAAIQEQSLLREFSESEQNPALVNVTQTITADNGKTYTIENDRPLNEQEATIIANALAYTDRARFGDRKEEDKLIEAMQAGLSPFAVIEYEGGKRERLDEFARHEVGRGAEKLVQQQQTYERQAAFQSFRDERVAEERATQSSNAQPNVYQYKANAPATEFGDLLFADRVVGVDGKIMDPATRSAALEKMLAGVTTVEQAEQFHGALNAYIRENPQAAASKAQELLGQVSSLQPGSPAANMAGVNSLAITEHLNRIGQIDPQGAENLAKTIAEVPALSAAANNARNTYASRPSVADLEKITIQGNDELQERLRNAINQQKSWDDMEKNNPIAGIFMMLLRPLLESLNPDSNPVRILEEAAQTQGVTINAPESVITKLPEGLRGRITPTQVADTAQAAEQPQPAPVATEEKAAPTAAETPPPAPAAEQPQPAPVATEEKAASTAAETPPPAPATEQAQPTAAATNPIQPLGVSYESWSPEDRAAHYEERPSQVNDKAVFRVENKQTDQVGSLLFSCPSPEQIKDAVELLNSQQPSATMQSIEEAIKTSKSGGLMPSGFEVIGDLTPTAVMLACESNIKGQSR